MQLRPCREPRENKRYKSAFIFFPGHFCVVVSLQKVLNPIKHFRSCDFDILGVSLICAQLGSTCKTAACDQFNPNITIGKRSAEFGTSFRYRYRFREAGNDTCTLCCCDKDYCNFGNVIKPWSLITFLPICLLFLYDFIDILILCRIC